MDNYEELTKRRIEIYNQINELSAEEKEQFLDAEAYYDIQDSAFDEMPEHIKRLAKENSELKRLNNRIITGLETKNKNGITSKSVKNKEIPVKKAPVQELPKERVGILKSIASAFVGFFSRFISKSGEKKGAMPGALPDEIKVEEKRPKVKKAKKVKIEKPVIKKTKKVKIEKPEVKKDEAKKSIIKKDELKEPVIKIDKKEESVTKNVKKEDPVIKKAKKEKPVIKNVKKEDPVIKKDNPEKPVVKKVQKQAENKNIIEKQAENKAQTGQLNEKNPKILKKPVNKKKPKIKLSKEIIEKIRNLKTGKQLKFSRKKLHNKPVKQIEAEKPKLAQSPEIKAPKIEIPKEIKKKVSEDKIPIKKNNIKTVKSIKVAKSPDIKSPVINIPKSLDIKSPVINVPKEIITKKKEKQVKKDKEIKIDEWTILEKDAFETNKKGKSIQDTSKDEELARMLDEKLNGKRKTKSSKSKTEDIDEDEYLAWKLSKEEEAYQKNLINDPDVSKEAFLAWKSSQKTNTKTAETVNENGFTDEEIAQLLSMGIDVTTNANVERIMNERKGNDYYSYNDLRKMSTSAAEYKVSNGKNIIVYIYENYTGYLDLFFTNDINLIDQGITYFNKQKERQIVNYLKNRKALVKKVDSVKKKRVNKALGKITDKNGKEIDLKGVRDIYDQNSSYFLTGVEYGGRQTTGNGCWSVSLTSQLKYRGLNYNQSEVRLYRPENVTKFNFQDEAEFIGYDAMGNPLEFSELMNKSKSNMAVHNVEISLEALYPNPLVEEEKRKNAAKNNKEEFIPTPEEVLKAQNAEWENQAEHRKPQYKEYLRKRIIDALVKYKSPVSFLLGGHYVTVYGIEGEKVYYYDSASMRKDGKEESTLDKLYNNQRMQLVWFEELKPESKNGCQSIYSEVDNTVGYRNGELVGIKANNGGKDVALLEREYNSQTKIVGCTKTVNRNVEDLKNKGLIGEAEEFKIIDNVYLPKKIEVK
ncbi:MAG: hypothetical protein K6F00_04330 [Lachnospiraceae bacterium]|nr:hypothetical protein [Lachnospiraceae bacterium]